MKTVLQSYGPKRRAILRSVIVVSPTRAKIVVVLFAVAMVYGLPASTMDTGDSFPFNGFLPQLR